MSSSELAADLELIVGARRDPVPFAAQLREREAVCWIPGMDAWLVTRHEDVRRLFSDARLTADPRAYERHVPATDPDAVRWLSEMPFRSTPADPESLGRRLVSAALTPRAAERMEARVHEVVEELAVSLRGRRGVVDLIEGFTSPLSANAVGRILGVPPQGDSEARFRELARRATRAIRPILSEKKRRKVERAGVEMCEYVLALIEERQEVPRADLLSDLLNASRTAHASVEDIARVVAALVSAGTGTTGTAGARALRTLLQHPDELALLRGDRSLLPNAVQELLRYDSGVAVMPRYVLETFELHERKLARGQLVVLGILSANRDPRVFPEPDRLDLRRDTRESLAFGHGAHYCVGANLARLELAALLDSALDFLPPHARLLEDSIEWSSRGLMSQMRNLPVDFG